MELKRILYDLRERYKWTNEECAINCGIGLSTWKRLLNGTLSNPRLDILCCLSKGFDVPIDYFKSERDPHMLTLEEYEHMHMYRSLPVDVQNGIKAIVIERYTYWIEQYKQHVDYGFRLEFRQRCAKLSISEIKKLLKIMDGNLE